MKKRSIRETMSKKLSFHSLQLQIEGYGFSYSLKKHVASILIMLSICLTVSVIYQLKFYYLIGAGLLCLFCLPSIIHAQFRYLYEQNKFNDIMIYLEQMSYSFQKHPKILFALKDTLSISEGKLKILIEKAIDTIKAGRGENIYFDALTIIEKEYECQRIKDLHKFLILIEEQGGNYNSFLNVLLIDFHKWTERIFVFQKDIKDIKNKANIAVVMSFFIASISLFLRKYYDITNDALYLVSSMIYISGCILYFTFMQTKINVSWAEDDFMKEERIINDMRSVMNLDVLQVIGKSIPLYIIFAIAGGAAFCMGQNLVSIILVFVLIYMLFIPRIKKQGARKRIIKEIQRAFPEWLREVALNLQFQTVQSAIFSSYKTCPVVLKSAVAQLTNELETFPAAVEPYYNFLKEFKIIEIHSAVKMLYSLSEVNKDDMGESMNNLIQANYALADKSSTIKNRDKINGIQFLIYIPMILASLKLLVDLTVFIISFLEQI